MIIEIKCIFALPIGTTTGNYKRELSSVGLEHLPYKQGVTGSNPVVPTLVKASHLVRCFFCLCRWKLAYKRQEEKKHNTPTPSNFELPVRFSVFIPLGEILIQCTLNNLDHEEIDHLVNALKFGSSSTPICLLPYYIVRVADIRHAIASRFFRDVKRG